MYEINIKIFIIYKAVVENIASHEITYLSLIEMEFEVAVRISYRRRHQGNPAIY